MKKNTLNNTNSNLPTHAELYQALTNLPLKLVPPSDSSHIGKSYRPIQPYPTVNPPKVFTNLQIHDTISNYPTFPELYQALANLPPLVTPNSSNTYQPVSYSTVLTNSQTQDLEKKRKINQSNDPKLPTKKVKLKEVFSTYTQSTVGSSSANNHSESQAEIKINDSITKAPHKKKHSQIEIAKSKYHSSEQKTHFDSTEITQPSNNQHTNHSASKANTSILPQSAHSIDEFLEPWEIPSQPTENNTVSPQDQSPNFFDFLDEIDYMEFKQTNQSSEDIFDYLMSQIETSTNEQDMRQNRSNESPTLLSSNPNSLFFHEDQTPESATPLEKDNLYFKY